MDTKKRIARLVVVVFVLAISIHFQSAMSGVLQSSSIVMLYGMGLGSLSVSVVANEVTKLLDTLENKEGRLVQPTERGSILAWISWPQRTAFCVLTIPGLVAAYLSQLFLDAIQSTLSSLQAANQLTLTAEGAQRLLLTIVGMIVFIFFVPVVFFLAVSVGARIRQPLSYLFLLASSACVVGLPSATNIASEAVSGSRGAPGQPVWARLLQLAVFILIVALFQWICVRAGFWLRKRRLA